MPPPGTAPRVIQTPTTRIINAAPDQKIASRSDVTTDAEPAAPETTSGKFLWPVRGRTIAGFGRRPDGTHNDGVNVAVPQGTAIHAAESGKVAYAGNEIKGYGNLVLIRHPNGWVTAYAHADQLLVRPNDEVRRGQVIAKAGKTGAVDQPQVHFELRQGSRPVDPMPHLAN
jgi:murein DD-endopeptidase MepM/ murein hydrolase activator NlpD